MRISDWSSDVCSSDLGLGLVACRLQRRAPVEQMGIGGQRGFGFFEGTQHRAVDFGERRLAVSLRSEEHTSELQSLMRISYAVFCLKKTNIHTIYYMNQVQRQTYHTQSISSYIL